MKIEDIKYDIHNEVGEQKDFDIEKWRKENPMDYLKALYLINTSSNKDEVFMWIYKITRKYIPDTLFKYYSLTDDIQLNKRKLDTLSQRKIFMADAKYLNDPFDNKAFFYKHHELKKYERLKNCDGKIIDDFSAFNKVTSLTANDVYSMPMWAHYSNNHRGFCISYDMKSNNELSACTFPIQYTDQRIDITKLIENQIISMTNEFNIQSSKGNKRILLNDLSLIYLSSLLCNLKHISWSYENEFRCTTGATAKGMPYISATPKEIYIGMNCLPKYEKKLINIANTLKIPIYKMYFDEFNEKFDLKAILIGINK